MDIKYFEYLTVLAEKQSISEAARSIFMEPSGLSKIITKMEQHYGVSLVERTPRGIRLTPKGELLLEDAQFITERYQSSLRKLSSCNSARLLVHYSVGIGRWLVPACQRAFQSTHPTTELDAHFFPLQTIHTAFSTHCPDISIVFSFAMDDRMQNTAKAELMSDSFALVISADHPLAHSKTIKPAELCNLPIVFVTGPAMDNTLSMLAQIGIKVYAQVCPNVQTADNLIRCGLASGIRTMSDRNEYPELCYIPIEDLPAAKLYAVYRQDNSKHEVQEFIQCARNVLWHRRF